ncbi:MAG: type III pantothenate kinase [Candidatus Omnitrophota bacterium]|nr:MAG: type III pantothenate kinase [Candidatus Omnitrophota bacterium]
MLLAIDIGNTNITFGIKQINCAFDVWSLPTKGIGQKDIFSSQIKKAFTRYFARANEVKEIVICSVVPSVELRLKAICLKIFTKAKVFILTQDISIPVKNKYQFPEQVGTDRLANALSVIYNYQTPAIIVDFGTAITVDVVSGQKEYLGGVITPGINMSLSVLSEKTALLPALKIKKPGKVLGRDTKNSILNGVIYGSAFMIDKFILSFKAMLKQEAVVLATGGNLKLMQKFCQQINIYDPCLTLKGIEKAYILSK